MLELQVCTNTVNLYGSMVQTKGLIPAGKSNYQIIYNSKPFKKSIFKGILGGSDKEDMMSEYNLSIIIYMVEYHNE